MTAPEVTLIAAVIAAISALTTLIVGTWAQRSLAGKDAHRKLLAPILPELGEAIHQSVATARIILKRSEANEQLGNWMQKAQDAKAKLVKLRWQTGYPLWGIEEGLRTLALPQNLWVKV